MSARGTPATIRMLDLEAMAAGMDGRHAGPLRLWLRLLTCSLTIENEIRARLRAGFGVTLPRFDLMAQLDKAEHGMTLSEVSARMMVSNGNVTALVERLVASGHVARVISRTDRRAQLISLTPAGRAAFAEMAAAHAEWIGELFAGLSSAESRELMRLLARTKASARRARTRRERP